MILEIQNPSDAVTINVVGKAGVVTAEDITLAGVAIKLISSGYGLENEQGETVVPITLFGTTEAWLKERGIDDIEKYIKANAGQLAAVLETVIYGKPSERALVESAIAKMSPDDAARYRRNWNDKRRSSLNDIGRACLETAKSLRKFADKPKEPAV